MKKIILLIMIQVFCIHLKAQVSKPIVSQGTTFFYTLELHGQHVAFEVSVKTFTDTLKLGWKIRSIAGGVYMITPPARQSADKLNFVQPVPNTEIKLPDNETFFMLSKKAFNDLKTHYSYFYDNTTYIMDKDKTKSQLKVGDRLIEFLHVTAQNETTEFWILDNPDFPVICQIKNNPLGINATLNQIK